MPKFLVEVPHADTPLACARIVKTFLETGSHYSDQRGLGL